MAQFRITQKFSADSKIHSLANPRVATSLLDDWVIDVLRIHRKKVAFVTNVGSLLTFLVPYAQVGGAKNIPDCISICLQQFLCDHDFAEYVQEMERVFAESPVFCKVDHRRMIGHMTDFKRSIAAHVFSVPFDEINWTGLSEIINNTLVNWKPEGYTRPIELMKRLLVQTQTIEG